MGIIFRVAAVLIAAAIPLPASGAAMPQAKVDYSADSIMEAQGMTIKSKLFHTQNKDRVEMNSMGMNSIVINRMDKKVTWMLMPDQNMYTEMDIKEGKKNSRDISDCKVDMKPLGSDTVNGVKTTKNKISMICPDKVSYTGVMWMTKESILMKMDASATTADGPVTFKMELQNLKLAKQDAQLFEVPRGYEKMNMGGMFGGGFSMTPPAQDSPRRPKTKKAAGSDEGGRAYSALPRDAGDTPVTKPGKKRKTKGSGEGRSYTAEPREGRSYTAEPRDQEGRSYTSQGRSSMPSTPLGNPVNKIRNFFGL